MEEMYDVATDVAEEMVTDAATEVAEEVVDTVAEAAEPLVIVKSVPSMKTFVGGVVVGVASTFAVKYAKKGIIWTVKQVKGLFGRKNDQAKMPVDGPIDGECKVVDETEAE